MAELKPCPCCKGNAQIRYIGNNSGPLGYTSNIYMRSKLGFVMCIKCGLKTSIHRVAVAVEKWNRRAEHWLDNADSYICPVCGFETDSPAKYDGCKCPKCGFQDRKDADNG